MDSTLRRRAAGAAGLLLPSLIAAAAYAQPTLLYDFASAGIVTDGYGTALAGPGDVDGDSVADVAVGAYAHDGPAGTGAGRVYVYSGATGATIHVFEGPSLGAGLGASVAGADVTGDLQADLIVGAPGAARVFVFDGATGAVVHELVGGPSFGTAVAGAGFVDPDLRADFIVGEPASRAAWVFSGATGGILHAFFQGLDAHAFGAAVGATFGALLVGAPNAETTTHIDAGRVFVYSPADGSFIREFEGEDTGDRFGSALAGFTVGDVDADGTHDIVVGAWRRACAAGSECGKAYVFSLADGSLIHSWESEEQGAWMGYAVGGAGDVNGDNHDDVLVGAPDTYLPMGAGSGRAIVFGGATGAKLYEWTNPTPAGFEHGYALAYGGDMNGDGLGEVITSNLRFDMLGFPYGHVYVYSFAPACGGCPPPPGATVPASAGSLGANAALYLAPAVGLLWKRRRRRG